jgi:hypothetical protein
MKRNYYFIVFFLISIASFAQEAPMRGWHFNSFSVTLNGRWFSEYEYAESWREQEGFALVQGIKRHYWLYDTYTYRNGEADELYDRVIPSWVENMGYVIDFDNIRIVYPNPDLASSVKALMTQRGSDISVTLLNESSARQNTLVINDYNRDIAVYNTTLYPLIK